MEPRMLPEAGYYRNIQPIMSRAFPVRSDNNAMLFVVANLPLEARQALFRGWDDDTKDISGRVKEALTPAHNLMKEGGSWTANLHKTVAATVKQIGLELPAASSCSGLPQVPSGLTPGDSAAAVQSGNHASPDQDQDLRSSEDSSQRNELPEAGYYRNIKPIMSRAFPVRSDNNAMLIVVANLPLEARQALFRGWDDGTADISGRVKEALTPALNLMK